MLVDYIPEVDIFVDKITDAGETQKWAAPNDLDNWAGLSAGTSSNPSQLRTGIQGEDNTLEYFQIIC